MKKRYYILIGLVLLIVAYVVARSVYPMYASFFPFIAILFGVDIYLWLSFNRKVSEMRPLLSFLITFLYWAPLFFFMVMSIVSAFYSMSEWSIGWRTYPMGIIMAIYFAKIFSVLFLVVADLIKVSRHLFCFVRQKKSKKEKCVQTDSGRRKFIRNLGLLGGGFVFSGLIIGMVRWAYDFRIRRQDICIQSLPEAIHGLKIVQISDMHLGSWTSESAMYEAVSLINQLEADLVFFTGDLVNFSSKEALEFEDALSKVRSKRGIYAILGNHDFGDYLSWESKEARASNLQQLEDFYSGIGWKLLRNASEIIDINGKTIAVIGVDNWSKIKRFPRYGDLNKAIKNTEDADVKILLSHDPTHWDTEVIKDYKDIDLTFAGHTHGFQFGVELKNFKWSPAQYMYKHWAGLYSTGDQQLYVNRGLGNIGYPGRIGILPEISLITLKPC